MNQTKFSGGARILTAAVCLVVIAVAVFLLMKSKEHFAEDPYWFDTHIETKSAEQAVELFGNDLLLDHLGSVDAGIMPDTKFVLELKQDGQIGSRETWSSLAARVTCERNSDGTVDYIALTIFFDADNPNIAGTTSIVGYDDLLQGSFDNTVVNGTEVNFREYATSTHKYAFVAKFEYGDSVYFLETYSVDDSRFASNTLERILNIE
jgi:hypothetical protein